MEKVYHLRHPQVVVVMTPVVRESQEDAMVGTQTSHKEGRVVEGAAQVHYLRRRQVALEGCSLL